jgi:hypothetical protein
MRSVEEVDSVECVKNGGSETTERGTDKSIVYNGVWGLRLLQILPLMRKRFFNFFLAKLVN